MNPWIGVDLDGTLAHYDGWEGADRIGDPVPLMQQRVLRWLAAGIEVRIVTARHSVITEEGSQFFAAWEAWSKTHLGRVLTVTSCKDFGMIELWDDRAVAVEHNTGVALSKSMYGK